VTSKAHIGFTRNWRRSRDDNICELPAPGNTLWKKNPTGQMIKFRESWSAAARSSEIQMPTTLSARCCFRIASAISSTAKRSTSTVDIVPMEMGL